MGTNERRAREREEMRGRILDAARDLFATQGYDAVTLRRVADCIEYCPATIYKYFRDKEEMVRALVAQDMAALMDAFRPSMAKQTPLERLRSFGLAYIDMGLGQRNHYRLMFMTPLLPGNDPMYREKRDDPQMDSYGLFLSVIQECVDSGIFRPQFRDAESIAQTIWAGLHGVISLHIALGDEGAIDWRPTRDRAVFILDLVLHGMLIDSVAGALPALPSAPAREAAA